MQGDGVKSGTLMFLKAGICDVLGYRIDAVGQLGNYRTSRYLSIFFSLSVHFMKLKAFPVLVEYIGREKFLSWKIDLSVLFMI